MTTLFYAPDFSNTHTLPEEESKHCIKVLRHIVGDAIEVTDGNGRLFKCLIEDAHPKKCKTKVLEAITQPQAAPHIHIAIAPTKNIDRIGWFVEKAVEIGINEISFLQGKNSERTVIKTERMVAKAVSAMKQSWKAWLPVIHDLAPLKNAKFLNEHADFKGVAHLDEVNPVQLRDALSGEIKKVLIVVGPEGDFTDDELQMLIEKGFKQIALGPYRLRTETAGIAALQTVRVLLGY